MLKAKEKRKKRILKVLPNVNSIEELCEATGLRPITLGKYFKAMKRVWPPKRLKPYRMRPEIDDYVDSGTDTTEIGELAGLSRQRAHQYLHENGLYGLWKEKRKKAGNHFKIIRKGLITRLADALVKREEQLFSELNWPEQKAWEYHFGKQRSNKASHPITNVAEFFSRYQDALIYGKRLSVSQLIEGLEIPYTTALSILRRVELKPFIKKGENLGRERLYAK